MATTTNGSNRIFHNAYHYRTSYYNQVRTSSIHKGTDYGTSAKALPQYPPLDGAVVKQVVTKETNGDARGCRVRLEWPSLNLGMILQHLAEGSIPYYVTVGTTLSKSQTIGNTGMTGKYSNGKRVSSGVHAHVEVYYINQSPKAPSSLATFDFETLDFDKIDKKEEVEDLTEAETRKIVKEMIAEAMAGDGKVPAWAVNTGEWAEAISKGIIASTDKNPANPTQVVTKAELGAVVLRSQKG